MEIRKIWHGRQVQRKLHIAVDLSTHEVIAVKLSLSTVTDVEIRPNLLNLTLFLI
ncbi:hypothetical protein VYA_29570 [Vibrio alfacsensis]|nr:hypothetical protein VYA_29570 [Vibrio alfacsensis]